MRPACADELICGDEHTVYADKAYDSKARSAALKARGIRNGIMRRWHWSWRAPSRWEKRRNSLLVNAACPGRAVVRAAQERLPLHPRPLSRPRAQ